MPNGLGKSQKSSQQTTLHRDRKFWTPEFILVVVMLIVLTVLVFRILGTDLNTSSSSTAATAAEILDYRKNLLSLILAAFGAWVGAGAAYFFGRESLREAASSLLAMREESPRERLRQTQIRELLPRPIDWASQGTDTLGSVITKLKQEPQRWFVPVVATDGRLDTVLNEEAVWRYVQERAEGGQAFAQTAAEPITNLRTWIATQPGLARLGKGYITVTLDTSALDANEEMTRKDVTLAIVTDDQSKPTHFITTGDVRRVVLQAH